MVAFPTPFDRRVELQLDGTWTDITSDVYQRDDVVISRGRSGEGAQTEPSRCSLTINNRTGDYSPRNPTGAHFGVLGRNTPLRYVTGPEVPGLWLDGSSGAYASAPDAAALDVTGDLDIRVRVALDDWTPGATQPLVAKWSGSSEKSWALQVVAAGTLQLLWTENGSTNKTATSSAATGFTDGSEHWVRVKLDVDNGASGHGVTFETSSDGETWSQLGSTQTGAGTTSVHAGTGEVQVGARGGFLPTSGIVGYAEVRDGIGGTIVADPDFAAQARNASSFGDGTNTWTVNGTAALTGPSSIRFSGEVPSWPQRWDKSGSDVWVPIEAAGILRRLGQGAHPLRSAMRRGVGELDNLLAYWPCEDSEDATSIASGIAGDPAMSVNLGSSDPKLVFAASEVFGTSSALPTIGNGRLTGQVPAYTPNATDTVQLRFLLAVPAAGSGGSGILASIVTENITDVAQWDLWVFSGGNLSLEAVDENHVTLYDSGALAADVNGRLLLVSVLLKDGTLPDIDVEVSTLEVGATSATSFTDTASVGTASEGVGRAERVIINPFDGSPSPLTDVAVGHVHVQSEATTLADSADLLKAWSGEAAGRRVERLCSEEGITFASTGDLDDTAAMGPQKTKTLLELLREAETSDVGTLYEQRDSLGLAYRTRASHYSQTSALDLDYSAADLSEVEPVDDDQNTRNDVTVQRDGGSSARKTLDTGALSTAAPPNGVGLYDESVTISVESDNDLPDQAGWRLHVGTVDEARYPQLSVNLGRSNFTDDDTLTAAAIDLDLGDKITVSNPPSWLPPDDITQLAQGFTETHRINEWLVDVNCAPASPYDVAVWDATSGPGEFRWESDGSTLDNNVDSTQTTFDVLTPDDTPQWSDADQPFDIYVGGERMTVTAISGATSPQTFTVTRSVNGVVKSHTAGDEVRLWKQAIWAL